MEHIKNNTHPTIRISDQPLENVKDAAFIVELKLGAGSNSNYLFCDKNVFLITKTLRGVRISKVK